MARQRVMGLNCISFKKKLETHVIKVQTQATRFGVPRVRNRNDFRKDCFIFLRTDDYEKTKFFMVGAPF